MTGRVGEPYRRWRIFVFAVVVVVAPLTIGGVVAAVVTAGASGQGGLLTGVAGAATRSSDAGASGPATELTFPQPSGSSEESTTTGPTLDIARKSTASASSTAPDNVDGAKVRTNYRPENMLDGDLRTAWRTKGNGAGVDVRITFPGTARLTEVGLVPGFAKIDPTTGDDRFHQNHRITAVNWIFSDGTGVHQDFTDTPTMQTIPVDTVADSVRIEIVGVLPSHVGYDNTPISEVTLLGTYR